MFRVSGHHLESEKSFLQWDPNSQLGNGLVSTPFFQMADILILPFENWIKIFEWQYHLKAEK